MKVAQILRRLSFDDWGGTESVVWETSRRLQAQGHAVELLATKALCDKAIETRDELPIQRFNYWYPYFPMNAVRKDQLDRKGGSPYVPDLRRYLMQADVDCLHLHTLGRMAQMVVAVAHKRGLPCVLSLHGGGVCVPLAEQKSIVAPTQGCFPYGSILDRFIGYRRDLLQTVDGVICVGQDEAEAMVARGVTACYLPNGVTVSAFGPRQGFDAGQMRAHWGIAPDATVVLCVARIDEQKNQALLIEWLARRRAAGEAIHLVLAGPITVVDYGEKVWARIRALGLEGCVTVTGALAPGSEALLDWYRLAEAFILPSRHEPFGIVALEAWAAGVPVIASNVGGLGRLVTAGKDALTFASGDLEGLEQAWGQLQQTPGLRAQLIAGGKETVAAYDWAVVVQRLEHFYQQVIERRSTCIQSH